MEIRRQVRRAEERKQEKADKKLAKQLELSDFTYEATGENMTFSAMGPQLVDFIRVVGLPRFLKEHIGIEKTCHRCPLPSGEGPRGGSPF